MRTRPALLGCIIPLFAACDQLPTQPLDLAPQFAGTGAPRFIEATASGPNIAANLVVSYKLAGLGSSSSNVVSAQALGSALWACMTNAPNEFNAYPGPERAEATVNASNTFAKQNGQVNSVVILSAPAPALQCLRPTHQLVPITTTFSNVQLSHADAGTFTLPGIFDVQNYFLRFEVVPTIVDVTMASTTLTIDGGLVPYTVTFNNTGVERTEAVLQGWIRQGTTYRAAGGIVLQCQAPVPAGTLPGGDCTASDYASAYNAPPTAGNGDLVPGPAVFELHLEVGASSRVIAGFTVPITLIS